MNPTRRKDKAQKLKAQKPKVQKSKAQNPAVCGQGTSIVELSDNRLAKALYGEHDSHLARLEALLDVELTPRGNRLTLRGGDAARQAARGVIERLYQDLERGRSVDLATVEAAVRFSAAAEGERLDDRTVHTPRRFIEARSPVQAEYLAALAEHELVFALGPAGTGKTYLAVAAGVALMMAEKVDRLILSRPAVEAGERLGFLPGDMREKVDPYLRPLFDALYDMLPSEVVQRRIETGAIEIAPLAFMRGRTLSHAFVILDEAQNATPVQMKMFLTRLGEQSRMVVTGDPSQIDLPPGMPTGLLEACRILEGVQGVAQIRLTERDVVRHPLVTRIVAAYNAREGTGSGQSGRSGQNATKARARQAVRSPQGQSGV